MANEQFPTGAAIDTMRAHEVTILKGLFPEELRDVQDEQVNRGDITIMRDVGNPHSSHIMFEDSVNGTKYRVNGRVYTHIPTTYPGVLPPPVSAFNAYRTLNDAGANVPAAFYTPALPNWLFTRHVTGEPLTKFLAQTPGKNGSRFLVDTLAPAIAEFQYKATEHIESLQREEQDALTRARSTEVQVGNYLEIIAGSDGDSRGALDHFNHVLGRALEGRVVNHGDLGPGNMIISQESLEGKTPVPYFIDFELKRRKPIFDLGTLIAYIGNSEPHWKAAVEAFERRRIELLLRNSGGEPRANFIGRAKVVPTEDQVRKSLFDLYASIVFGATRIAAKRKSKDKVAESPDKLALINLALQRVIEGGEYFELDTDKLTRARELRAFYQQHLAVAGSTGNTPRDVPEAAVA